MVTDLPEIRSRTAAQQPGWSGHPQLAAVRDRLARSAPLVGAADVHRLRTLLARVAAGAAHVVWAGDCAEDPADCTTGYTAKKAGLLDVLAGTLKMVTHTPVLRVGRIAGQFAKPRSAGTEHVGGLELPVYRGHMVNSPEPDAEMRRPDPSRMLDCHRAAGAAMAQLGWSGTRPLHDSEARVWTSHEALLLDYEIPMLRRTDDGGLLLASTHLPWIGERTREPDGAHVALLAGVVNPVACKVGPGMRPAQLLELCERLDPRRDAGRLCLIARLGAGVVAERLPGLVAAVRDAGHPAVWLCDPMHGNTVVTPAGFKTRYVETLVQEIQQFQLAVRASGGVAGGLHLETTPDEVTECVLNESFADHAAEKYTSLCDPRLNPEQAMSVVAAWQG